MRFINEVIHKTINIFECSKNELLKQLFDKEYNLYDSPNNIISEVTVFDIIKNQYDYKLSNNGDTVKLALHKINWLP